MLFPIMVMKSLKSFPVPSPCSDLLSIVNKRILKYSGKSTYPFHPGPQCSTWLCVLVLEIINGDVKPIVIKESCLLKFLQLFLLWHHGTCYNNFYWLPPLTFKVYMIAWGIKTFWEQSLHRCFPSQSGLFNMQITTME